MNLNRDLDERQYDEFATGVRKFLDRGLKNLDGTAALRLYEARQNALRHQAVPVAALSLAGIGHFLSDSLHDHFRAILAALALAIGGAGMHFWQNAQQATEMAEIDSALLSDEVSPAAYTDQGFLEWLDRLSQQEEESLPE